VAGVRSFFIIIFLVESTNSDAQFFFLSSWLLVLYQLIPVSLSGEAYFSAAALNKCVLSEVTDLSGIFIWLVAMLRMISALTAHSSDWQRLSESVCCSLAHLTLLTVCPLHQHNINHICKI
jgi:hypothetical protein